MDFGIVAGDTDQTIYVRLRDSTTGLAKTGLAFNSAGAVASYTLPGAARAAITLATQTVTGAHSDGGFVEVDATNCKGLYRLDLPDAAIASGKYSIVSIEFDGIIEESVIVPLSLRKSDVRQLAGVTQSLTDLKDFADDGYDPSTNKVQGLVLADTVTTLTNLPSIPANWLTAAGTAADFGTEMRTVLHGGDWAADMDANGRIRIVDGTGAGELDTSSGLVTVTTTSINAIADQIWEEAIADHSGTTGSTAEALNAAGSAGDPWTTALPGAYGAGSAGFIIGTNINATVSSRSSHSATDVWAAGTRTLTAANNITSTGGTISVSSGAVTLADGVTHGGTTAKLRLGSTNTTPAFYATNSGGDAVKFECTGNNSHGLYALGNGSGDGAHFAGGVSGDGIHAEGGSTTGYGLHAYAPVAAAVYFDGVFDVSGNVAFSSAMTVTGALTASNASNSINLGTDAISSTQLATTAVQEIRNAITGGAYALDTDVNGRMRIVDGTGAGELNTTSGAVSIIATEIRSAVGLASADLDTQLAALPTAAENATALLDLTNGIETSVTPRQALRGIAAFAFGLVSDAGTGTEVFKGAGQASGGTTRLTYTVDGSGNRTAVTLNL